MRVLVVEDERRLAGIIKRGLIEEGYAVDVAYDGEEAQYRAEITPYDLIILDIMLPQKDGINRLPGAAQRQSKYSYTDAYGTGQRGGQGQGAGLWGR